MLILLNFINFFQPQFSALAAVPRNTAEQAQKPTPRFDERKFTCR